MIEQGGVKIDGERRHRPRPARSQPGETLTVQVGKRKFARVALPSEPPLYEVYALKYAHHARRAARELHRRRSARRADAARLFRLADPRRRAARSWSTPASPRAMAAKRGRDHLRCPTEALRLDGCRCARRCRTWSSRTCITTMSAISSSFPAATLHLQELEMRYATGRYMCSECFRGAFDVEDVVGMVRRVYAGPRALPRRRRASSRPASRCTSSAATRWACRSCASRRGAAGWCSPPTRATSTPTWSRRGRFRSSGRSPTWSTATSACARSPRRAAHIIPGHDPLVMERYPRAAALRCKASSRG